MVKIISAFSGRDPIAGAIASFASKLGGGGNAMTPLEAAKLRELERANVETELLMKAIAGAGAGGIMGDPTAQARALGAGIDPKMFSGYGLVDTSVNKGWRDPATENIAFAAGVPSSSFSSVIDQNLAAANAIAAKKLAEEARQYDAGLGFDKYKFDMEPQPVMLPEQTQPLPGASSPMTTETLPARPGFMPRSDMAGSGAQPILSEAETKGMLTGQNFDRLGALDPFQREMLGANVDPPTLQDVYTAEGTVKAIPDATGGYTAVGGAKPFDQPATRMYVAGGKSFMVNDQSLARGVDVMGQPVPPGGSLVSIQAPDAGAAGLTNAVQTDVQSDIMAANRFTALADRMLTLTQTDPTLFGVIGQARSLGQETVQAIHALNMLFGEAPDQAIAAARADLQAKGLSQLLPEIYDPNLPKVEILGGLLLYSAASALAGQENRSVSDKDVALMRQIIGDPRGIFESAPSVATKVGLAREIVLEHKRLAEQYLAQGLAVPPGLADQAAANVMSGGGAPAAPASPAGDGLPVVNSPEEAARLPRGTRFKTPDGRVKVVP